MSNLNPQLQTFLKDTFEGLIVILEYSDLTIKILLKILTINLWLTSLGHNQ